MNFAKVQDRTRRKWASSGSWLIVDLLASPFRNCRVTVKEKRTSVTSLCEVSLLEREEIFGSVWCQRRSWSTEETRSTGSGWQIDYGALALLNRRRWTGRSVVLHFITKAERSWEKAASWLIEIDPHGLHCGLLTVKQHV